MIKTKPKSSPYYNIGQLRVDYWNKLKIETAELARCIKGSEEEKKHKLIVNELLKSLKGIDCFFAAPGKARIRKLDNALTKFEYTSLSNLVAETTKQLVGDSYRSNPDFIDFDEHTIDSVEEHEQYNNIRKNHFEVLFVDDISEQEETALQHKLRSLRASNDKFTYSVVVQRSFQDALIALLFNHNIQAVVVRYAPPYHSKGISPLIRPYIQPVSKLDFSSVSETDLGPIIATLIRQFRPELDAYYVTDTSLGHLKNSTIKGFSRIFYQTEDIQELHLTIIRGIVDRFETPFFSALVEYSQKPTGVFHAMPISRGNSVFKSRWINDFGDFYGRNLFWQKHQLPREGLIHYYSQLGPLKKRRKWLGIPTVPNIPIS